MFTPPVCIDSPYGLVKNKTQVVKILSDTTQKKPSNKIHTVDLRVIFCWPFYHQNWMAYQHYPSAWKAKESSVIVFSENELPAAENNYALCKVSHICTLNTCWYVNGYFPLKVKISII